MKPYSSKLRALACKRQRLSRLSIRLYVPRVITRFQEAKTLVLPPFIIPPSKSTMRWNGRLLVGRWRTLWSGTESRYLLQEAGCAGVFASQEEYDGEIIISVG
jgi:hypothetical protein